MKWKQDYVIFLVLMLLAKEFSCEDCQYGSGIGYRGSTTVTKRNITCQNWDSDHPHVPQYSSLSDPDKGLQRNYCRNPNNDNAGPWCYTSSPAVRWEYCNIPMCGCEEWEMQNNSMCICKEITNCGTAGPIVCDDEGNQYLNHCAFSASICHGLIPLNRTQGSCGNCTHLKLTRGEGAEGEHPKYGLISFEPTGATHDGRTVYRALLKYRTEFVMQYDVKMQRWIIGKRSEDGQIHLAAFSLTNATWPQDSIAGWWIVNHDDNGNEIWKEDIFLQLQCFIENANTPGPRFIWFLIAAIVVSLITTTTSAVIHTVQQQKGCLWYPSVCTLTTEVRDLSRLAERKKDTILKGFGNPIEIKIESIDIFSKNGEIRSRLYRISLLMKEFSTDREFFDNLKSNEFSFDDDLQKAEAVISSFELQMEGELKSALIGFSVQGVFSIAEITVISATISTATAVLSIVGGVISVAMFIYDIVHSVQRERQVRDDLIDAKQKILTHISRLNEAEKQIQTYCELTCKTDILYLGTILELLANYLKNDQKYDDIQKWNNKFNSIFFRYNKCDPSQVNLKHLKEMTYIQQNLIEFLDKRITELGHAIETVHRFHILKEQILENVKKEYSVTRIVIIHPELKTQKDALVLLALLLPEQKCYWGYDLESVRKKDFTNPLLDIPVSKKLIQEITTYMEFEFPLNKIKDTLCLKFNHCISDGAELLLTALARPELHSYNDHHLPNFPCRNSLPASVVVYNLVK
ncbi:uncharacterized protein LOC121303693 [Polyodon spathula]|uniref:uncharacterized protein LOC121303693 n=1 Tax=Polyodon spathula TaxID=7913 RepID=UPI001B7E133C|nr:uncharacterized protein LOC121303693 [Polyodon spathula]